MILGPLLSARLSRTWLSALRALSRPWSAAETREVERLFLDSIDTAERSLYVENQFFTSSLIAERIATRMQAKPQLETLLVGPQNHESWVEARTMRNGRIRFMRTFAEAGVAGPRAAGLSPCRDAAARPPTR